MNIPEAVYCKACGREIHHPNELTTQRMWLWFYPFHKNCWHRMKQGWFLYKTPNILLFFASFFLVGLLFAYPAIFFWLAAAFGAKTIIGFNFHNQYRAKIQNWLRISRH